MLCKQFDSIHSRTACFFLKSTYSFCFFLRNFLQVLVQQMLQVLIPVVVNFSPEIKCSVLILVSKVCGT